MRFKPVSIVFLLSATAVAGPIDDKVRAAMDAEVRSEAEVLRDDNRKPLETLNFFGMQDDMTVLELLPGGGWYTKILAPVLRDAGELHVAIGADRVRDNLVPLDGFDRVRVIEQDVEMTRDGEFGTRSVGGELDFGGGQFDMVLTFRNMHNFTPEGRAAIDQAVFQALKPGGVYGVVDHSRRHMQAMTRENRRRVDVVQIIREVQSAGFMLEDFSDLHYRPDDELRFEVGRHSVTGNTDRFTLRFRKP